VGSVDEVGSQRQTLLDGLLRRDGEGLARRDCRRLGGQRRVLGDTASQQATEIWDIRAGQIGRRVAAMADRRVVGDELLLNKVYCVHAGNEDLRGDKKRHEARQDPPSRPSSKRSHASTYR
jgi:hypothetical protein